METSNIHVENNFPKIIQEISIHENRILGLLDNPAKYKSVNYLSSKKILFLETNDFVEKLRPEVEKSCMRDGVVDGEEFNRRIRSIEGKRTLKGEIVVHVNSWEHGKWVPNSDDNLENLADHEKTHGMLIPAIIDFDEYILRKTGCKEVMIDKDGKTLATKGHHTYESQTQILTSIGAHPEAKSFKELAQYGLEYNSPVNQTALCVLLDLAFPDFEGGTKFLADQYFSADSNFVQNVLKNAASYYGVEIDPKMSDQIIDDSNSSNYSKSSVDFYNKILELKKVLIPTDPIEEFELLTSKMSKQTEPSDEDIDNLKKLIDRLKKSLQ